MAVIRVAAALALAAGTIGCFESDPFLPSTAKEFTPPATYNAWWSMAQSCSGMTGSLSDVRWFSVPANTVLKNDANVVAYWTSTGNHVVVEADHKLDGPTIRHEMLHAILRQPTHSREYFLDKCAGYVACAGNCLTDAGTAQVPPETPYLAADSFEVSVRVTSNPVLGSVNNGWFAVIVSARNPTSHTVLVDFASPGTEPRGGYSFGYIARPPIGGTVTGQIATTDFGLRSFGAGQTREQAFDLFASGLQAGSWRVFGLFGLKQTASSVFEVRNP